MVCSPKLSTVRGRWKNSFTNMKKEWKGQKKNQKFNRLSGELSRIIFSTQSVIKKLSHLYSWFSEFVWPSDSAYVPFLYEAEFVEWSSCKAAGHFVVGGWGRGAQVSPQCRNYADREVYSRSYMEKPHPHRTWCRREASGMWNNGVKQTLKIWVRVKVFCMG